MSNPVMLTSGLFLQTTRQCFGTLIKVRPLSFDHNRFRDVPAHDTSSSWKLARHFMCLRDKIDPRAILEKPWDQLKVVLERSNIFSHMAAVGNHQGLAADYTTATKENFGFNTAF